ncbi:MAG: cyclic pyranopterin monophosphate synthase MoaC [Actinobacteria bacterium]|nr:cyclic pyranopterin monophosphate synthase MoaC [Actinomycetota bacterium]
MSEPQFSHLDEQGRARMVDVGAKDITRRRAVATARVSMSASTATAVGTGTLPKGDVLAVARVAGIQAAKRTAELIPLCHPLAVSAVSVDLVVVADGVEITATVETTGQTGVEMEALTAVSVAALTVYDMCKSADRDMVIGEVMLVEKSGGRSGTYTRPV